MLKIVVLVVMLLGIAGTNYAVRVAIAVRFHSLVAMRAHASRNTAGVTVGIAFDEIHREATADLGNRAEGAVIRALHSASPLGFDSDYRWYKSHPPNQYGARIGPDGEHIYLYRYAFFGNWSRFQDGDHVTIVYDGTPALAYTLNLKARTYHRFSSAETKRLMASGLYALAAGIESSPSSIGGEAVITSRSAVTTLPGSVMGGMRVREAMVVTHESVRSATGTCISGDNFGSMAGYSLTTETVDYRTSFPEPGRGYDFSRGMPFIEGNPRECDRHYIDLTQRTTTFWSHFTARFLLFERTEEERRGTNADDGITLIERGHIRRLTRFDVGLFGIPRAFRDDCTRRPRATDCPARSLPRARVLRRIRLHGAPYELAADSRGNVWFTEPDANRVGYVGPTGAMHESIVPTSSSEPDDLVVTSDGAVWFVETAADPSKLGSIDLQGSIIERPLPDESAVWEAAEGPRVTVWLADEGDVAYWANSAAGVHAVKLPTSYPIAFGGLSFDNQGALWYIETNTQRPRVVRFSHGTLSEYHPPHDLATLRQV